VRREFLERLNKRGPHAAALRREIHDQWMQLPGEGRSCDGADPAKDGLAFHGEQGSAVVFRKEESDLVARFRDRLPRRRGATECPCQDARGLLALALGCGADVNELHGVLPTERRYSCRSASIGSRLAARCAGSRPKNSPTPAEKATASRITGKSMMNGT